MALVLPPCYAQSAITRIPSVIGRLASVEVNAFLDRLLDRVGPLTPEEATSVLHGLC